MCIGVFFYKYLCSMCKQFSQTQEEGYGSHGTRITDRAELLWGDCESNLDVLEEQQVVLTAESFL